MEQSVWGKVSTQMDMKAHEVDTVMGEKRTDDAIVDVWTNN